MNELCGDLKQIGVKIMDNIKFNNGYGEGICLILTQLLDKYLINQNFIFNKPKFIEPEYEPVQNDFEEIILEDNLNNINDKTQNTFRGSKARLYSANRGRFSAISQGKIL
jgi:hypothetical protein